MRNRRSRQAVVAIALVMTGAVGAIAATTGSGVNLNFFHIDTAKLAACKTEGKGATFRESVRLTNYDKPQVRQKTQADLARMVKGGGTWARSLIWYATKNTSEIVFVLGQDEAKAKANLRALAQDLSKAGVTDWIISFGPQGSVSTACRRTDWGDCYDPSTIGKSEEFIFSMRRALDGVNHPRLWVDLINEQLCYIPQAEAPRGVKQGSANAKAFLEYMLPRYAKAFPKDRLSISCGGNAYLQSKLTTMTAEFKRLGVTPAFVDVHIYEDAKPGPENAAEMLANTAKQLGKPAFVGETLSQRPDVRQEIMAGFDKVGTKPAAILTWPVKNQATGCAADVEEIP